MILLNVPTSSEHSSTSSTYPPHHQHNMLLSPTLIQYIATKALTSAPHLPTKRPREPSIPTDEEPPIKRQKPSSPRRRPSEPAHIDDLRGINWYGISGRKPANVTPDGDSDSCSTSTISVGESDDNDSDLGDDDPLDRSDSEPDEDHDDDSGPQIDTDSTRIARWLLTHAAHNIRGRLVYPLNERTNRVETLFRFDTDTDADEPVECQDHPVWSSRLFYDAVGIGNVEFTGADPDGEWCVFLHERSVRRRLRVAMVLAVEGEGSWCAGLRQ
ncbi:MAG: hypothetical protein M1831_003474 [Alyxoria varia]|nr:MAG: hypothetical protein M1831_003474 [Alyxoria varia]